MTRNGLCRFVAAVFTVLSIAGTLGAASADDLQSLSRTCAPASDSDLWQQALDLDGQGKAAAQTGSSLCLDPTEIQEAGGCCMGHGGPAGCDAESHMVRCADGKKSKSCAC
jgi:hypothetical protein